MLAIIVPVGTLILGILMLAVEGRLCREQRQGKPLSTSRKFVNWFTPQAGVTLTVMGTIFCLLALGGGLHYTGSKTFIAEFKEAKITIESQRGTARTLLERATMAGKIIDLNSELAQKKYWNSIPIIGWYLPDELSELERIQ